MLLKQNVNNDVSKDSPIPVQVDSWLTDCTKKIRQRLSKGKKVMPRPGFEPGLLRPQRRVLTTRRSRQTTGGREKFIGFES